MRVLLNVVWFRWVWSPLSSWTVVPFGLVTARTGKTTWVLLRHRKTDRYTSRNSTLNACFSLRLCLYTLLSVFCNWLTARKRNDQAFETENFIYSNHKTSRTSWSWLKKVGKRSFWLCESFRSAGSASLRLHLSSSLNNKFQISGENVQNWVGINFEWRIWTTSRCLLPTRPVFSERTDFFTLILYSVWKSSKNQSVDTFFKKNVTLANQYPFQFEKCDL